MEMDTKTLSEDYEFVIHQVKKCSSIVKEWHEGAEKKYGKDSQQALGCFEVYDLLEGLWMSIDDMQKVNLELRVLLAKAGDLLTHRKKEAPHIEERIQEVMKAILDI